MRRSPGGRDAPEAVGLGGVAELLGGIVAEGAGGGVTDGAVVRAGVERSKFQTSEPPTSGTIADCDPKRRWRATTATV